MRYGTGLPKDWEEGSGMAREDYVPLSRPGSAKPAQLVRDSPGQGCMQARDLGLWFTISSKLRTNFNIMTLRDSFSSLPFLTPYIRSVLVCLLVQSTRAYLGIRSIKSFTVPRLNLNDIKSRSHNFQENRRPSTATG